MLGHSSYICDACAEEIVIPLDLSKGNFQKNVEDCPVCCSANNIHVFHPHLKVSPTSCFYIPTDGLAPLNMTGQNLG